MGLKQIFYSLQHWTCSLDFVILLLQEAGKIVCNHSIAPCVFACVCVCETIVQLLRWRASFMRVKFRFPIYFQSWDIRNNLWVHARKWAGSYCWKWMTEPKYVCTFVWEWSLSLKCTKWHCCSYLKAICNGWWFPYSGWKQASSTPFVHMCNSLSSWFKSFWNGFSLYIVIKLGKLPSVAFISYQDVMSIREQFK